MRLIEKRLGLFILIILIVDISLVSMVPRVNVALANPTPHLYVDPSEVHDVPSGGWFVVKINVTEAPLTYAWRICLSWDPGLLQLARIWDPYWKPQKYVNVTEGSFLDRRYWTPFGWVKTYPTNFLAESLDKANSRGEITVGNTLVGSVPWASGNGWLCSLNFTVQAQGSTLLNLFKTRLADYTDPEGYPAYTDYPNNDCFFYNVAPPIHDIRITDITVLTTSVHLGEVARINVTVLNEGTATETFDLYVYADIDPAVIGDEIVIGPISHSLNGAGNSEYRSFTFEVPWNTAGCSKVSYTISAYVPPVSSEGDTDDNTRIDSNVWITKMLGDVNGDDMVEIYYDLFPLGKAYGSVYGGGNWNEDCDFNIDGKVDKSDLEDLTNNYGRSA